MYPKIIIEHFMHPKNVGRLENPSNIGTYETLSKAKAVFYFLIEDDIVKDIKYQVAGCPYAIAVGSILSEYAKGKRIFELAKINKKFLEKYFPVDEDKEECINLPLRAFLNGLSKI